MIILKGKNICFKCGKLCIKCYDVIWCNTCSLKYMQENLYTWSGNEGIDNFIKEKQQKTNYAWDFFEWIPYNKFENIKIIKKEEFVTIYFALWKDRYFEFEKNHRIRRKELKVVLKCLDNCKELTVFLNKVCK